MARDRPLMRVRSIVRDQLLLVGRRAALGQGLAEYALILSLIAVVAISMLITLGQPIQEMLSNLGQSI